MNHYSKIINKNTSRTDKAESEYGLVTPRLHAVPKKKEDKFKLNNY